MASNPEDSDNLGTRSYSSKTKKSTSTPSKAPGLLLVLKNILEFLSFLKPCESCSQSTIELK
ncbi:ORF212 [Staphylococcus phage Twort]|uniref:ORF212 n=1 Tax=Staphylococcus phage Twort (strain DSM 17442 / HER 48) TaxID=2908167 RepID=Q4Z8X6_BPTWO|nr:ORF212 [Staphylococcus phage Twort]AAX92463.1 ORF212 [Staphylococcus phage Twort]